MNIKSAIVCLTRTKESRFILSFPFPHTRSLTSADLSPNPGLLVYLFHLFLVTFSSSHGNVGRRRRACCTQKLNMHDRQIPQPGAGATGCVIPNEQYPTRGEMAANANALRRKSTLGEASSVSDRTLDIGRRPCDMACSGRLSLLVPHSSTHDARSV